MDRMMTAENGRSFTELTIGEYSRMTLIRYVDDSFWPLFAPKDLKQYTVTY